MGWFATKEQFGRRTRIAPSASSFATREDKQVFLNQLFNDAKSVNPREPAEINKNTVDVNEKITPTAKETKM